MCNCHCTLDVVVSAAVDGGKLMGYFNLPWFAWGSAEMNLGDTVEYNTLVRVTSPYYRLATAIIKLFVHYHVIIYQRFKVLGNSFIFKRCIY